MHYIGGSSCMLDPVRTCGAAMWLHARTQPPHESPQCRCGNRGSPIILQSLPQRCYSPRSYGLRTVLCSVVLNIAGATESEPLHWLIHTRHPNVIAALRHWWLPPLLPLSQRQQKVDSYLSTHTELSNARHRRHIIKKAGDN
jgi:hypothetical protein